ncbi:carbohydrate deacetylase [Jeotgalibaca caeni]|uniref:carbohydrate deacetylase n=1 Tax=Jeotgalibaca caeni TaxID=3028623 RepID=UPI00237E4A50|nr:ChbG/HpnK family deacetylase [Jeotgalibaca caeni]MDE1548334.1 ChbG/HpnK family deacetylase [Jeotgalibaca caeni]
MTKSLIVTADDFGICQATNEAIEELARKQRITSVSFLLSGKAADDAVKRAKSFQNIGLGLHLTLTSDFCQEKWQSHAPAELIEPLLDEHGYFHTQTEQFYELADSSWVNTELAAQFSCGKSQGITFDHLDSHQGILYGDQGTSFLSVALHFCATHHVAFRFPKRATDFRKVVGHKEAETVEKMHAEGSAFVTAKKMKTPDALICSPVSHLKSYEDLKNYYLHELRRVPEGVTELFLHPSKETSEYFGQTKEWQSRVWEYRFLLDDAFFETLEAEGIQLTSWRNTSAS